jgi:hypothetical protein
MLSTLERVLFFFISSSTLRRLALTNAISIPEKKAEKTREMEMVVQPVMKIYFVASGNSLQR